VAVDDAAPIEPTSGSSIVPTAAAPADITAAEETGTATGQTETPGPRHDVIRLVLPAEPDYGRIARIAASSLALRLGLTFAEIEDLRIAVDETVILLLRPEGDAGQITLEFTVEPHALAIDATTTAGTAQHWFDVGALSRFTEIVGDTVDVHEVDEAARRVHLVKRY
jgi:hypothetical protein